MKESQSANRPILRKASSLAAPQFVDEIRYYSYPCEIQIIEVITCHCNACVILFLRYRWMKLRKIDLITADGLPPLPMQISWVRDGILVVGMDSEMHVYSQWKPNCKWWLFICTYAV